MVREAAPQVRLLWLLREVGVVVVSSQPQAVRNGQTGQLRRLLHLEPWLDRGVSGPVRCGKARRV